MKYGTQLNDNLGTGGIHITETDIDLDKFIENCVTELAELAHDGDLIIYRVHDDGFLEPVGGGNLDDLYEDYELEIEL